MDEPEPTPEAPTEPAKPDSYTPPATQADLDRIISERLTRDRAKYADYADLKRKAEAYDEALEAAKTAEQKAVDAARQEGEQTATQKANARVVRAEARALAATAKFRDPSDAVKFLDLTQVAVGDDGEPDSKALNVLLDQLAKDKPYLVDDGKGGKPKPDPGQGGTGSKGRPGSVAQVMAERAAARAGKN